ncbi:hypothetical protein [Sorangium sp. So ce1389]|uniref:hypothetical protein n=1 Tax=Sorangium sp. So ce1389 TaxID=3133336 RepID=UPI003F5E15E0
MGNIGGFYGAGDRAMRGQRVPPILAFLYVPAAALPGCLVVAKTEVHSALLSFVLLVVATAILLVVAAVIFGVLYAALQHSRSQSIKRRRRRITGPPGCRLHALAGFFYSRKTMERVFDPMLADMRSEYFEALANGRIWKARWHRVTYYWAFVKSIGLHSVLSLAQEIVSMFKILA